MPLKRQIYSSNTHALLNAGVACVYLYTHVLLAAVAIPAFQGVQSRAKVAAVKNGMVNGVKECIVSDGLDLGRTFDKSKAYAGDYTGYTLDKVGNDDSCYHVGATPEAGSATGWFILKYDPETGVSTTTCDANSTVGCTAGKW